MSQASDIKPTWSVNSCLAGAAGAGLASWAAICAVPQISPLIHGRHSLAIMPVMAIAGIYAGKRYPGLSDKEAEEYWATLPPPKESKQ